MEIKDLKDPRDRAACEWAERSESIHDIRARDDFRRKQTIERAAPGFDAKTDKEFNEGIPRASREQFESYYIQREYGVVEADTTGA